MAAFRDDFPQNPPPLQGDDWSKSVDRNPHDSLEEVRGALKEIAALVAGLRRLDAVVDGELMTIIGMPLGTDGASVLPWGLEIVDGAAGQVRIKVGTIIADMADVYTGVTITNPTEVFTPSAGDKIWLEITDVHPVTEATLVMGSGWGTGGTETGAYVTTGSGASIAMVSCHHAVWEFAAAGAAEDGYRQINADLWGIQTETNHLRVIHTPYQKTISTHPVLVPVLVGGHRVLT